MERSLKCFLNNILILVFPVHLVLVSLQLGSACSLGVKRSVLLSSIKMATPFTPVLEMGGPVSHVMHLSQCS